MRDRYEEQLRLLNKELAEMGGLCEEGISYAVKYLTENKTETKQSAEECEKQIDRMERDIESLCMRLLMHEQPLATDFRLITAALKMISDMERIGDHAEGIVEIGGYIAETDMQLREHISEMAKSAVDMLTASINSYIQRDAKLARNVILMDDTVDEFFIQIKQKLISVTCNETEKAESVLDLLMIAKYFERIGDHAENIAEWVIYAVTGTFFRNGKIGGKYADYKH